MTDRNLRDALRELDEHMLARRVLPLAPLLLPAWAADIPEFAEIARNSAGAIIISESIPIERAYE